MGRDIDCPSTFVVHLELFKSPEMLYAHIKLNKKFKGLAKKGEKEQPRDDNIKR